VYITGLNQVTDVEIDKINKPYLPVASGALKFDAALATVVTSLLAAVATSLRAAWPLKVSAMLNISSF